MKKILIFIALLVMTTKKSHAYIDPGSGSYLLQIFLAFVLGSSFALRSYWKKLFNYLSRFFKKPAKDA